MIISIIGYRASDIGHRNAELDTVPCTLYPISYILGQSILPGAQANIERGGSNVSQRRVGRHHAIALEIGQRDRPQLDLRATGLTQNLGRKLEARATALVHQVIR